MSQEIKREYVVLPLPVGMPREDHSLRLQGATQRAIQLAKEKPGQTFGVFELVDAYEFKEPNKLAIEDSEY